MSIHFACACGKSFQTKDEYAGKHTKCPACGAALVIPKASASGTDASIRFACTCGKEFKVKAEYAGRSTKCPSCGAMLVVPGGKASVPSPKPPPGVVAEPSAESDWEALQGDAVASSESRPAKAKKRPKSKVPLIIVGVVAALLAGGGGYGAYYIYKQNQDAGKPIISKGNPNPNDARPKPPDDDPTPADTSTSASNLPPDLNLVPRGALGFVSVRVADFWNSPLGQLAQQQIAKAEPGALPMMEQAVGLTPADIERVTLAVTGLSQKSMWAVVTTTKPYDKAKLLQVMGNPPEKKHAGKNYHYAKDQDTAVHFLGERLLIAGPEEALQSFLAAPAPKGNGPLAGALTEAAGKHHVLAAVNPPGPIIQAFKGQLPPEAKPFEALLDVSGLTLRLHSGTDTQLDLKLAFPNEAAAKKSQEALRQAVALGQQMLGQFKQDMTKGPEGAALAPLFQTAETLLQKMPIDQKGASVEVQVKLEQGTTAMAAALLLPAIEKLRGASERTVSSNNLKELGLAMHSYHGFHGRFPPAAILSLEGKPLYSWRVELLPYLEQKALYDEFKKDEPWDSTHNMKLLAKMPKVFALEGVPTPEPYTTFFQVFTGPATPFTGAKQGPRLADFRDGSSATFMMVEAAEAVPWTKPVDLVYAADKPLPKLGGHSPAGFLAVFCDGATRAIAASTDEKKIRAAITPAGGEDPSLSP